MLHVHEEDRVKRFNWLGVFVVFGIAMFLAVSVRAQQQPGYSGAGAKACLNCHENETVLGIAKSVHATSKDPNAPVQKQQCEACHGPSKQHMKFPMQIEGVRFTKGSNASIAEQNGACLECHEDIDAAQWGKSSHGAENVICSGCHQIHQPRDALLEKSTQAQACASCHEGILGEAQRSSPHPVAAAEVSCADCHNPHEPMSDASCVACHGMGAEDLAKQSPRAREFHTNAQRKRVACGECHKGLAHGLPEGVVQPAVERDDPHEF